MESFFTTEHKVINDLLGRDMKYVIPEYQRPYSWDCAGKSEKNNQVNVMWSDLIEFFESKESNTYFLGSMVLIGNGDRVYQVIDGQQRLTTILLLIGAIKCFLKNQAVANPINAEIEQYAKSSVRFLDDLLYNQKLHGAMLAEKKVKIEKTDGFDFDKILNEALECKTISEVSLKGATSEQRLIALRYFNNRGYFEEKLGEKFLANGSFTQANAENLNDFIDFLKNKVSVVRILTGSFEIAYHVFETLNNRGLPLSNKDLFRNFLIKEFDQIKKAGGAYAAIEPHEKWNELDGNFDLRDEFIGRWVESTRAAQQRYSSFNDLKEIYESRYADKLGKKKIESFFEDFKQDLGYYNTIIENSFSNPKLKCKINVLLNAGNQRYSMNFLLALLRQCKGKESDLFLDLVNQYELYLLLKLLTGRFSNGPVYSAIARINEGKFEEARKILETPPDNVERLIKYLNSPIEDNDTAKLLIAKFIWLQESNIGEDVVNQNLEFNKSTLEHIIPQSPLFGTNWVMDFSEDDRKNLTYLLGNMTLLTQRRNAAANNYDFSRKKPIYANTKLSMTTALAAVQNITPIFIQERHEKIVSALLLDLGISEKNNA